LNYRKETKPEGYAAVCFGRQALEPAAPNCKENWCKCDVDWSHSRPHSE